MAAVLPSALALVRLPHTLDVASVDRLASDLAAAIAAAEPVVLVAGASSAVFCEGAGGEAIDGHAFSRVLAAMHHAPKPLLAVVEGRAVGEGVGLACACDWVVATPHATFALPALVHGQVPAIIWPVVADRMAPHTARQWVLSGAPRPARPALDAGLVDELVGTGGRLDHAVDAAAAALGRLDARATARLRQWARVSRRHDLPTALSLGTEIAALQLAEADGTLGRDAGTGAPGRRRS